MVLLCTIYFFVEAFYFFLFVYRSFIITHCEILIMTTLKCLSDNSDISDISDLRSTIYFPSVWDLPGSCMMSDFEWNLNIFVLCCEVKIIQLCPTLCDLIDSTVHGILQARVLECGAFPFSRASSQPRDWTQVSHIAGGSFTNWAIREVRYAMRLWI